MKKMNSFRYPVLLNWIQQSASLNLLHNFIFDQYLLSRQVTGDLKLSFRHVYRDRAPLSLGVRADFKPKPWPHCTVGNVRGILPPSLFNSIMFFPVGIIIGVHMEVNLDSQCLLNQNISFEHWILSPCKSSLKSLHVAVSRRMKLWLFLIYRYTFLIISIH